MSELTVGQIKLMQEVQIWEDTIDAMIATGEIPKKDILLLKQTPLAMALIGADVSNNLFISPKAFSGILPKASHSEVCEKHDHITADVLKLIPRALTDPIAVIKTEMPTRYIYMLDVYTANKATVVAEVEFVAQKEDGTPVTLVTDVFSVEKDGAPDNNWLISNFIERPAYCNTVKWSEWAIEYNGGEHERTGYYVTNIIQKA